MMETVQQNVTLPEEILFDRSLKERTFETVEVSIPLLEIGEESGLDRFREKILKSFKKLNFRRVGNVIAEKENWMRTEFYQPQGDGNISLSSYTQENVETMPDFSEDDYKRKVVDFYTDYKFYTTKKPLRTDEDKIGDGYILCEAKNHCQLNPFTFKFDREYSGDERLVLPREGDLVCLLPISGKGGRIPEAKYWFVCSEQFMKAWTLIVYKDHDTFKKLACNEQELRKKVFSGNFTMTNGFRKWMLSCYQSGLVSEPEEIEKRFWVVRGERLSREFVHFYSALVLMLRYRELPSEHNIPNVANYSPVMHYWDLPFGWLEKLNEIYNFQSEMYMRMKETEVFDRTLPPKGTKYA